MLGFTYAQLLAALQAWPQNAGSEYVTNIPRMVEMGELRLIKDLNLDIFDQVDSSFVLTVGNRLITKPVGHIQTRALRLALVTGTVVGTADLQAIAQSQATASTTTAMTINGTNAPLPITLTPAAQVSVTQTAGSAGGVVVAITGTDYQGLPVTEEIVSQLSTTILGVTRFATITAVTSRNGSAGQTVKVGKAAVSASTLGRSWPVAKRSKEFCDAFSSDPSVVERPRYFNELNTTNFEVAQAADQSYAAVIYFVKRPTSIVVAGTSWLGDRCGELLFACSLMESEHYLKADDRYEDMKTKYYEQLLPTTRAELRESIRVGDYTPFKPAAKKAS